PSPRIGRGAGGEGGRWLVRLVGLLCVIVVLALMPDMAAAHAELVRSDPGPGAALGGAPARIDLWFSETLSPNGSSIRVYDSQRKQVDTGNDKLDPHDATHLSVSLGPLADGTYTVAWTSASVTDG